MEAKGTNGSRSAITDDTPSHTTEPEESESMERSLSAIDRQYAAQTDVPRRIHILGTGSIGKLVAHSLRGIPNPPPITLILHRYTMVEAWQKSKRVITIQDEDTEIERGGFDIELQSQPRRRHGVELEDGQPDVYDFEDTVRPHEAARIMDQQQKEIKQDRQQEPSSRVQQDKRPRDADRYVSNEPIHNLIVTTKAALTVPALLAIRHRLSNTSTICFLQNGMGITDDVSERLFPDEEKRPNYVQGIISHGANVPPGVAARDPFFAVHAGHGTIALGLLPRSGIKKTTITAADHGSSKEAGGRETETKTELWAPSARYMLRTLTRSPVLCAVGFTPIELLQLQLEKLAVNSILNPLTALIDARNGDILYNFALTRTMRLMLAETSLVIRSLPELQSIPNVNTRFSPDRLETLVVSVAYKTRDNISSMLADVRAGRKTEIEFINGYIVRRGEEQGIKCVVNYAIMQTVIGKCQITQREVADAVPTEGRRDLNAGSV